MLQSFIYFNQIDWFWINCAANVFFFFKKSDKCSLNTKRTSNSHYGMSINQLDKLNMVQNEWPGTDMHSMFKLWTLFANLIQRWKSLVERISLLFKNQFIFIFATIRRMIDNVAQTRESILWVFVQHQMITMKLSSSITIVLPEPSIFYIV